MHKEKVLSWLTNHQEIRIISFDLFDTLIKRTVVFPTDIFEQVEKKINLKREKPIEFKRRRISAESMARKKRKGEVNLKDIYDYYSASENEKKELMQLEIATEIESCVANPGIVELLISLCGKYHIIITTDMYLPRKTLIDILEKCGISRNKYDYLFVSGEIGVTKKSSFLFDYVAETLEARGYEILHIGDNFRSDYEGAIKKGWNAFYIGNNVVRCKCHWQAHADNERALRNLFCEYGKENLFNASELMGFTFVGPIICSFCSWIHSDLERKFDKIIFLSREGYLIERVYRKLFPKDKDKLLYMSINRKTLLLPMLYIDHSIDNYLDNIPINDFGKEKSYRMHDLIAPLFLDEPDCDIHMYCRNLGINNIDIDVDYSEIKSNTLFEELFYLLMEKRSDHFAEQYKRLERYFEEMNVCGTVALVNNSISGSAQRKLMKLFGNKMNFVNIQFVSANRVSKYQQEVYFGKNVNQYYKRLFFNNCLMFEHLLFPDCGTSLYYDIRGDHIDAVCEKYHENSNEIMLKSLRRGCFLFTKEYSRNPRLNLDNIQVLKGICHFINNPFYNECQSLRNLIDYDDATVRYFIDPKQNHNPFEIYLNSEFKQGALKYYGFDFFRFLINVSLIIRLARKKLL